MKTATLTRTSDTATQCTGVITLDNWQYRTLERGWHDNQHDISCIPTGTYECHYTRSNRLSQVSGRDYYTYEVMNVPDRSGIRIHSASFANQLLGCISLGLDLVDLNSDGNMDVIHSKEAIFSFESEMDNEPFELTITESFA